MLCCSLYEDLKAYMPTCTWEFLARH